ncbi:MAG: VWA domain-containing protein [Gammaproteobacteria bacterium]
MTRTFRSYLLIRATTLCLVVCASLSALSVAALNTEPEPTYDVRVLIDISGSMKRTDPQNLRRPALRLVSEMIPKGATAGVWTFGRFVNMLVPLKPVDQSWRDEVKRAVPKINSVGLFTNIPDALEKASYGWEEPPGKTVRNMIVLTDGKVDIDKDPAVNARARQDTLNRLIPRLRAAHASVHTIALSDDVDAELLQALSYQTNGRFQSVQHQEDLVRVFLEAFDASVPGQQVPLGKDNGFSIDANVKEFTVLVYKTPNAPPSALQDPNGQSYTAALHPDGVRWFEDKQLDVVTVTDPVAGAWKLLAEVDPDNRVTVVSDLRLELSELPNTVLKGDALMLDISLQAKEGLITNPDFLGLIDLIFSQNYIDGNKVWQGKLTSFSDGQIKTPKDGIYHARLQKSLLPGEHAIVVKMEGRTFTRQITKQITVIESVVKSWVDSTKTDNALFSI